MSDADVRAAYVAMHERARGSRPTAGERALSVAQYDAERQRYLSEHGTRSTPGVAVWPPTSQTVMKQLGGGSWAQAMTGLGLTAAAGRTRGAATFDEATYLATVEDFLHAVQDEACPDVVSDSFSQFSAWLAAPDNAQEKRPSAAAVRRHFGSWAEARRRAEGPSA